MQPDLLEQRHVRVEFSGDLPFLHLPGGVVGCLMYGVCERVLRRCDAHDMLGLVCLLDCGYCVERGRYFHGERGMHV